MFKTAGRVTREGREIAYRVLGDGPRRTVWIGGTNVDGRFWDIAQTSVFAPEGGCLLVDAAGTGDTDPLAPGAWSAESMAGDVIAAMDAVSWPDAHVIGHSLGAAVAAELAHLSPRHARSISLHAGWKAASEVEHIRSWFQARRATALTEDPELIDAYAFLLVSPHYLQRFGRGRGALHDLATRVGSPPLETKLGHYEADLTYSGEGRLQALDVPALVTAAEHDQAIPPFASEQVARLIPGAHLRILTGVGHLAPLEDPGQFNRVQAAFIDDVERSLGDDVGRTTGRSVLGGGRSV